MAAVREQAKKATAVNIILNKYDANESGKLEEEQVRRLLADLDHSTPEGTPPTDEEVEFIMKMSDQSGDNCIGPSELEHAITAWRTYTVKKQHMGELIDKYDKSGEGTLSKEEMSAYLTDLNDGKEVSEEEVDWVIKEADVLEDGVISRIELVMATAAWYSHLEAVAEAAAEEKAKSKACCIL